MEFLDARRLTGPSLLADVPGTILDVECTRKEALELIPVWTRHVERMLDDLGWEDAQLSFTHLSGGISLFFTAEIDALYAASEINEWAWAANIAELKGEEAPDYEAALDTIKVALEAESNPTLLQLNKRLQPGIALSFGTMTRRRSALANTPRPGRFGSFPRLRRSVGPSTMMYLLAW